MHPACLDDGEKSVFFELPDCSRTLGNFACIWLFVELLAFLGEVGAVLGSRGVMFFVMSDMVFIL